MIQNENHSEKHPQPNSGRFRRAVGAVSARFARLMGPSEKELNAADAAYHRNMDSRFDSLVKSAHGLNLQAVQILQAYATIPHGPATQPRQSVEILHPDGSSEKEWSAHLTFSKLADRAKYLDGDTLTTLEIPQPPYIGVDGVQVPIHTLKMRVIAPYDATQDSIHSARTELYINQLPTLGDGSELEDNDLLSGQLRIDIDEQGAVKSLFVGKNDSTGMTEYAPIDATHIAEALDEIQRAADRTASLYSGDSFHAELDDILGEKS